jgi:hypothetical protein
MKQKLNLMNNCRNFIKDFDDISNHRDGYAVASVNEPDIEQGWECNFVHCFACRSDFIGVYPKGYKTIPCVYCENREVWIK